MPVPATIQYRINRALEAPGARALFCDRPSAFFAQLGWSWDDRIASVARDGYLDLLTCSEAESMVARLRDRGAWATPSTSQVDGWSLSSEVPIHDVGIGSIDPLAREATAPDGASSPEHGPRTARPSDTSERQDTSSGTTPARPC